MPAQGSQTLTGTSGDDHIKSNGNSDDTIFGLAGNDDIDAGAGMDIIDGGEGNDVMRGGAHADTFVFGANSGVDIIEDFKSGEDSIDLSGTTVTDLTGRVTDDGSGNTIIDLGGGNSVTLLHMDAATFLANPANYTLATGTILGINDTFTDAGDGTDQVITGDVNGEADTDTDTFIFGPNNGNDTINDFRYADAFIDPNTGFPVSIPGDSLDLSAYGIFGADLGPSGFLAYFDTLVTNQVIDSYTVTLTDTVINFTTGDSLTLLGIGENEIGIVIEQNMVRTAGGAV